MVNFHVLPRPMKEGHKLIVGLEDHCSHWVRLEPMIEETATTKIIFKYCYPFPNLYDFCLDQVSHFTSNIYALLTKAVNRGR